MTDRELPDSDNVVLYAKPSQIADVGSAEVEPIAFTWDGQGEGLSANWLEYFSSLTKDEQLDKVRKLIHRDMRPTGGLAELNVGNVVQHLSEELDDPRFLHRPSPPQPPRYPNEDPTHCELAGLPQPDEFLVETIGDMIAQCVSKIHPTRSSDQQ
jgi:hypothetical protein